MAPGLFYHSPGYRLDSSHQDVGECVMSVCLAGRCQYGKLCCRSNLGGGEERMTGRSAPGLIPWCERWLLFTGNAP